MIATTVTPKKILCAIDRHIDFRRLQGRRPDHVRVRLPMDVVCELSVRSEFQHVPSSCPSKKRAFGVGTYNSKVKSH